jgi:hypothetical protein
MRDFMQIEDYHIALRKVTKIPKLFYFYYDFRRRSSVAAPESVDSGTTLFPTSLWSGKHQGYLGENDLARMR